MTELKGCGQGHKSISNVGSLFHDINVSSSTFVYLQLSLIIGKINNIILESLVYWNCELKYPSLPCIECESGIENYLETHSQTCNRQM